MVFVSVPLSKSAKGISVLAEGDPEATASVLKPYLLKPRGSDVAPLSVPERASSAVPKRVKKPVARSECTLYSK